MSDESTSSAEQASAEAEPTLKIRRISNKNPKKAAKVAKEKMPTKHEVPIEEFDSTPPAGDDARGENSEMSGEAKRKNRRRRGKGKSSLKEGESSAETTPVSEETINLGDVDSSESSLHSRDSPHRQDNQAGRKEPQNQRPPQKQRNRPDQDKIAKNAWKIFLAEVSEEGVALIGDNDARELARRCFRLAEIFLEEEGRRN